MALFDESIVCPTDVILLRDFVPKFYYEDDGTTLKFVDIFEGVYCQLMNDLDNLLKIIDLDVTDERFIDLILSSLGFDLKIDMGLNRKRKLAKVVIQAYKQKGTSSGIENVIRQFTGIDAQVFPSTLGWILGISMLGDDTYLNPSPGNPREFYTFDVLVSQRLSQDQRRVILQLIELMKPAHTHFNQLIEAEIDPFLLSILVVLNRGTLFLYREQNSDGGWDSNETDSLPGTVSLRTDVAQHALGEVFGYVYNGLPVVKQTAINSVTYLLGLTYNFDGTMLPSIGDISLLNRGASTLLGPVAGALTQRDAALYALREFMKALAFLNNANATPSQVSATTVPERNATTLSKRAQFLFLNLIGLYGLAEGIYRFSMYVQDFREIGDTSMADAMAEQLYSRTSIVNMETDFGAGTIRACAAIVIGLQKSNIGLIYESRITAAQSVIDARFNGVDRLYYDLFLGTGRMDEQAMVLDAWMERGRFDEAKVLLEGIKLKQRVNGTFDDPVDPGTSKLRSIGRLMDVVGRAIKRIDDEGL